MNRLSKVPQGALIGTSVDLGIPEDCVENQLENAFRTLGDLTGINRPGGMDPASGVPKPEGSGIDTTALEEQSRLFSEWMKKNKSLITMLTIGCIITGVIGYTYLR